MNPKPAINVRVFPALLRDRRKVLTATSTSGNPKAWSRVDLLKVPLCQMMFRSNGRAGRVRGSFGATFENIDHFGFVLPKCCWHNF
jgi:hypothetical protein